MLSKDGTPTLADSAKNEVTDNDAEMAPGTHGGTVGTGETLGELRGCNGVLLLCTSDSRPLLSFFWKVPLLLIPKWIGMS